MEALPDALTRLMERVQALEQRVTALEHPGSAHAALTAEQEARHDTLAAVNEFSSFNSTRALSTLGRAMLGIAGAYLLRALAEWNALPHAGVAAVAILYALAWLVAASRARAGDWLRGSTYACTSALILMPMLWELTLRFKVLAPSVTAAVLAIYVFTASALGRRHRFTSGLWVSYATGAAVALGLAIATRSLIPFVSVLLMMALIAEYRAGRTDENDVRVLTSLAADVGIWALIYIYAGPQNARADYPALNEFGLILPGAVLFLISGTGVIVRTVVRRERITRFETVQATIAFLLAACGAMYFGPQASAMVLGILCLGLSAAGYATTLFRFSRDKEPRNSMVFAAWSGALFVAGSMTALPAWLRGAWLGLAAPMAVFAGLRLRRPALQLHGLVYLVVAGGISGLLTYLWSALAGTIPGAAAWGLYVVSICAAVCYLLSSIDISANSKPQVVAMVFAAITSAAAAALLVTMLVGVTAPRMNLGAHHVAFFRTLTACLVATGLAFGGARWRRGELARVAYAVLALLAVKLVLEDLRHGHLAFVAGSISLFAVTLIAVPRVVRAGVKVGETDRRVSKVAG